MNKKQEVKPLHEQRPNELQSSQGTGKAGVKDDGGKLRYDLIPWQAIKGLVQVLTFGARKYSPNGWMSVPDGINRYKAATMRHWVAIETGEFLDPETGLPHIYHVLCNVVFLAVLMPLEQPKQVGEVWK